MCRIALAVTAVGLFATNAVLAHEGHAHKLMGTVTAVHAEMNHVVTTKMEGKKAIATEVKLGDGASGKGPAPKASPHQH